jgi:hypothetical protein
VGRRFLAAPYAAIAGFVSASGCYLVTNFDPAATSAGGAASSSSASDGGSTMTAASTGAGSCEGLDLMTDAENCGQCGFACGERKCDGGRCSAVLDLGPLGELDRVVVADERLYFVQRLTNTKKGLVRTLPFDFTETSSPELDWPIVNGVTFMAVGTKGTHHVYISHQNETPSPRLIYACSPTECVEVDIAAIVAVQVNGITVVDDRLYILSVGDGRVLSLPIDPVTGVPSTQATYHVTGYEVPITNAGVLEMHHSEETPPAVYWSSWDMTASGNGCIYRYAVGDASTSTKSCWSAIFSTQGFEVTPSGTVFAQDGPDVVDLVPAAPADPTMFASSAAFPRALDDAFLYVADASFLFLRALPLDGGPEPATTAIPTPPGKPYGLTADHPSYVFYTAGSSIVRGPKPVR